MYGPQNAESEAFIMILVWGGPYDGNVTSVVTELAWKRFPFLLVFSGGIWTRDRERLPSIKDYLSSIHAAYVRPEHLPGLDRDRTTDESELRFLWSWLDSSEARIYNRPRAGLSNESKLGQASAILRAGFLFPESIVTTSPVAAEAFCSLHGSVVVKGLSGERTVVRRYDASSTNLWANVASCPTLLQEYVAGRQYRVHVVDDFVFVHEIATDAPDYRYASRWGLKATIIAGRVPPGVAKMCLSLAESLELPLAGLDLISPDPGRWYCLEVNPSPAFDYFEKQCKLGIAEALAMRLAGLRTWRDECGSAVAVSGANG
jgi:RimK-like ATP-grasp domain